MALAVTLLKRFLSHALLACAFANFFTVAPVCAQQTTATLVGSASDSTGGAIPDVAVKATNLETNVFRGVKTDQSGSYSIPAVSAGEYSITASKTGFKAQKIENITLQVDQTARQNFIFQIGNVSEVVDVSASAAALQTENSTVGTVIDSGKIVDLPAERS